MQYLNFTLKNVFQSNEDVVPVSRADVAEVVVSALLDPNASNICFYMSKQIGGNKQKKIGESLSNKFAKLDPEALQYIYIIIIIIL